MSNASGECRGGRCSCAVRRRGRSLRFVVGFLLTLAALGLDRQPAGASGAANANTVLILDGTVTGGLGSNEAMKAAGLGYTVEVASAAGWAAKSTADFSTYRAIILGDPTCTGLGPEAPADANKAVWGPAINGNVILVGTDPTFHVSQGGDQLTEKGIAFAASDPTKTGAYITLSCYYHGVSAMTPVPFLSSLGAFTVTGVGCFNDAHIVAVHPALAGLTDATISNWSCSVHEAFDSWPATFQVLAIARNIGSVFTAADGSVGTPYILARGQQLVTLGLSLTPSMATNAVGTTHTVTATLTDVTLGTPIVGALIGFQVTSGPNTGASGTCVPADCETDASGQVTFTYLGAGGPGTDVILAFNDSNGSGTPNVGEPQVTATKEWIAGGCVPADCNDGNPCTNDICGSVMGAFTCQHSNNTDSCDDGHPCTVGDTCLNGSCQGGPPPNCGDDNPCTDDSCGSVGGAFVCNHDPLTGPCDDSDPCTVGDMCDQGACVSGPLDVSACLDHYKCYKTRTAPFPSRTVSLVDQFGTSTPTVVRPTHLCNPADKNGGGILDPTAHLMCYQLREPTPPRRDVLVRNQFGDQTLTVVKAESLCNPAQKNGVPSEFGVDHFKCYRVRGRGFVTRSVSVTDQFETQAATLVKPRLLCNPVDKNGEGILNPAAHLTCYTIKASGAFAPRAVSVVDQFAQQDLSVLEGDCRKRAFVCVPSLKNPD
jgi:hypothetical protein